MDGKGSVPIGRNGRETSADKTASVLPRHYIPPIFREALHASREPRWSFGPTEPWRIALNTGDSTVHQVRDGRTA
jgi:hypothetical protein